jgi:dissimilatory sulfite reductase (desulfoviridin) alpha/beta subunit
MEVLLVNNSRGVSLLEIVIAAFILAIAFIPILRMVDFGSVATAKVGHYAKATRLAQELIEECKHVPFKVYQKHYSALASGDSFTVHPQFYKETAKSIEAFFEENKDTMKDYGCNANLKAKKNDLEQIVEVWFEVEIFWREMGKKDDERFGRRIVRAGNSYYNAEAM